MDTFIVVALLTISCLWRCGSTLPVTVPTEAAEPGKTPPFIDDGTFTSMIKSIHKPEVVSLPRLIFYDKLLTLELRLEFFTIASGDHLGLVPVEQEPNVDAEHHNIAMAISDLWLKLPTMVQIEEIIKNVTAELVKTFDPKEPCTRTNIMKLFFDIMEAKLAANPQLYVAYREAKFNTENRNKIDGHKTYFVSTVSKQEEKEIFTQWFMRPRIRRFLVNKLFLQESANRSDLQTDSNEYERYILARSILELSKNTNFTDEVQRIYDEVISEIADHFAPHNHRFKSPACFFGEFNSGEFANKTAPVLFQKLADKLDSRMNIQFKEMKMNIRERRSLLERTISVDYWPV